MTLSPIYVFGIGTLGDRKTFKRMREIIKEAMNERL